MKLLCRSHASWTGFRTRQMARLRSAPRDGGYSTEAVIVTALLAGLALTAIGIVVVKVVGRANGISLE